MTDEADKVFNGDDMLLEHPWDKPAFEHVVDDFMEEVRAGNFKDGDTVPFEWFHEKFGIPIAGPDTPKALSDKWGIAWMAAFVPFRALLLSSEQIALDNKRGAGYTIVPAKKQTKWATREMTVHLRKAYMQSGARLANVRYDQLDVTERKENADAMARLAALRTMTRKILREDPPLTNGNAKLEKPKPKAEEE